ncbi:MAG: MtrB/PioB family outer membrane beta-barrel protein, partial [Nitrospirae bacterium]|nr:MtrB/PioB family outer membrane beta-barrel protein [Nitrospirota bacterium]
RDSHTIKAGIDYSPLDVLNLGATLSFVNSEHSGVTIGRRSSQGRSASIYAEYTPFPALLLYSQYFYDRLTIDGSYAWRYDSVLTYAQDPNPLYSNFVRPVTETSEDTARSSITGIDYHITDGFSVSASYRKYDATGRSINLPAVLSATNVYELNTSYRVYKEVSISNYPAIRLKDLRINAGYYIEKYRRDDYALDNFPDPVDAVVVNNPVDIFLGIREPGYRLNIFSISLSFYF